MTEEALRAEVERLRARVAALEAQLADAKALEARLLEESEARNARALALAAEVDRYRIAARNAEPPTRKLAPQKSGGAPRPPPPPARAPGKPQR